MEISFQPTSKILFESLINCVLITSGEQIPPIAAAWTREAGSHWGFCAYCLFLLTALSFIISPWLHLSSSKVLDAAS